MDYLDAPPPPSLEMPTKYLVLYSPQYHEKSGAVVVRPDEVTIVTLMDEVRTTTTTTVVVAVAVAAAASLLSPTPPPP